MRHGRPGIALSIALALAAVSAPACADVPASPTPSPSPFPFPTQPPPRAYVSAEEEYSPDYDDETGQSVLLNLRGQLPYLENGQQYILRVKIPLVISAPPESVTGVGDSTLYYYAVSNVPGGRWTYGATMRFPTAGDSSLGSGKYSIGPAAGYESVTGDWTLGVGTTNYFSVIGPSWRKPVAQTKLDPSATYSLPLGWAVGTSSMSFTYNWYQGAWVEVPLGIRIQKAFGTNSGLPIMQIFAPLVGSAEFEKNLSAAADTPSWTIKIQLRWTLPRRKS